MAYVVNAVWTAGPGRESEVRAALEALSSASRGEEGNLIYQVYQDPAEPAVFRIFEVYRDEAGYAAHAASSHFATHALERALPLLARRERTYYVTLF